MTFRPILYLGLLLPLVIAVAAFAQGEATLQVVRPILHTEQDKAELCLQFDHALDTNNRAEGTLKLDSSGKAVSLSSQNLSIVGSALCMSGLDHHKEYRVTVTNLRGANNEKLAEPYKYTFTIPDRNPSLVFVTDHADGLIRWHENDPVLHAINTTRAKIEFYQITDTAQMVEAWRQRAQSTLAPSESAYFARTNGKLIWQGEIALADMPNKMLEQKIPLRATAGNLSPGLYLVVASAPAAKAKEGDTALAPLAAAWLLRSELNIHALRSPDGYYALADKSDASATLKDTHFIIENASQQNLAEGQSDSDGIAFLATDKVGDAVTLVGFTPAGDVAFADLMQNEAINFTLPDIETTIKTDKDFYLPGSTVDVALSAHDAHNHPALPTNTHLQLLRPDQSMYASLPVPNSQNGVAHITFSLPTGNGAWSLVWQKNDGHVLAESKLRMTSSEDAPHLEMTADRSVLSADGTLDLTLKSVTASGRPAPYLAGHIAVSWVTPDHIFSGWDDYHFGDGDSSVTPPTPTTLYITDEKGLAQLHVNLPIPNEGSSLRAAIITAPTDPAAGAADPESLRLPVRPKDFIIGIKPFAADAKFAENSLAHFDIIALDGDGKRRATDQLSWQIYEEGRSFDWYQAEGRWDYKQLQQRRRIGGGEINVKNEGSNGIEWQVTAGTYRLEVADSSGHILASLGFSAGWTAATNDTNKPASLVLTPSALTLRTGEVTKIHFKLSDTSIVSAVVADDHIRKVFHFIRPAGDNEITLTPEENWGNKINIRIESRANNDGIVTYQAGQIILPMVHTAAPAGTERFSPPTAQDTAPLTLSVTFLPVLKIGDQLQFAVTLKNNNAPIGIYHYNFTSPDGLKFLGSATGSISLNAGQSHILPVALSANNSGSYSLKLDVAGAHNIHVVQDWPLAVVAQNVGLNDEDEQKINAQQSWSSTQSNTKSKSENGIAFISAEPLYDAPQILAAALQTYAFTTHEIADELEVMQLWHDAMRNSGLLPEQAFFSRQQNLLTRLALRQRPDGGFAPQPGVEADMVSTSYALSAMATANQPNLKPTMDQAADWLKRHLDNSWFDEAERPERAAAYAALADADRLDNASLHYFTDTSADKNLPPLAALQLAAALAKSGDQDKANYYIEAAHIARNSPDIAKDLLPLIAASNSFDIHDILPALEKLSVEKIKKAPASGSIIMSFLRSMGHVQNRTGTWRVALNNGEQNVKNILIAPVPETSPLTVRNPGDKALYVTEAHITKISTVKDDAITRHIYKLNGTEASGETLNRDESYLIIVEGPWPDDDPNSVILMRDNVSPALRPTSCALGGALETNESLAWIKAQGLTATTQCEKTDRTIDASLTHHDTGTKTWRVAYLAKAEWAGVFTLSAPRMRATSAHQETRQGRNDQIRIR